MLFDLSYKKLAFIFSALVVIVLSVVINFGYFIFMVIGVVGYHIVKPYTDEYFKNRQEINEYTKIDKIVNKLSDEQKEALKKLLMGD